MRKTLSFDDVLLQPQFSDIESRSEVQIGFKHSGIDFSLPIISSPMDTVTETEMATTMAQNGALGVIHRYNTITEQVALSNAVEGQSGFAVGVTGDYLERIQAHYDTGAQTVCVDIAHGHHTLMEKALGEIKSKFGDDFFIIAGNVATARGYADLCRWGADAIRVSIGGGSICSTRIQTGHGVSTFQAVLDCQMARDLALTGFDGTGLGGPFEPKLIIADGGIKNAGDIVKVIAAGADLVMLGSLLAGTSQAPGQTFVGNNGKSYKVYRGMASIEAQEEWKGEASSLEGVSTTIPYKGSVETILGDLAQNIRSGFSYSGARSQKELREKAAFDIQTHSGQRESRTHILDA